jgi:hypothetical protein
MSEANGTAGQWQLLDIPSSVARGLKGKKKPRYMSKLASDPSESVPWPSSLQIIDLICR